MSDDKRAAFEAWYSNSGKWPQAFRRSGESYVYAECAHAWTVWQAAAAYERQRCADFVPLYTADQMREAIAAERERSDELAALRILVRELRGRLERVKSEPQDTMSDSKAVSAMVRHAKLGLQAIERLDSAAEKEQPQ